MLGKLAGAWRGVARVGGWGGGGAGAERPVVAEEKEGGKKGELPVGLERIPGTALMVMSFRVADLWHSDFGKGARQFAAKDIHSVVKQIEDQVGVAPAEMERLTVAFL